MTICDFDKNIRYGKLSSGLTYYVRHNENPKGLACFYLVKNIGSVIEDDNERGFAHFLEHMSFEGSSHFPGNGMQQYLESIGVRFGEEYNAYTSADETVYTIKNVPVSNENCSKCIQILTDWVSGLSLTDEAIESEKNVILEEFRVSSTPMYRMIHRMFPVIYNGCRYSESNVLGKYEIIENISHENLRNFYHKWSRPELSAIIIIGDFDADEMELKVKSIDIPKNDDNSVTYRPEISVPDNDTPIIAIERDQEQETGRIAFFVKREIYDRDYIKSYECLRDAYVVELIVRMFNSRYMYIANSPSTPFVDPVVSIGDFIMSRSKQALDFWFDIDMDKFVSGFSTAYRELRRAVLYGFSQSELQKAKLGWMASMESNYLDRVNRTNQEFADEYKKHFTHHEPLPSIDDEYAFAKRTIPEITLEEINNVALRLYDGSNLVVACFLPEKSTILKEDVITLINNVDKEQITPSVENAKIDSLIQEEILPAGKVISKSCSILGYNCYKLSNGLSVYLKSTDLSEDEILMYAVSKTGKCCFDISDYKELFAVNDIVDIGGLGNYSKQQLYSFFEDKQVEYSISIDPLLCYIKANTAVKNFDELLQAVYLIFTSPRYDLDSYKAWKEKKKSILRKKENNYLLETQKILTEQMFKYFNFYNKVNSSEIDSINYDRAFELFCECFSNPSEFSFIITGNISEEVLIPYLEKYIASLPSQSSSEKFSYHHVMNDNNSEKTKLVEMESPSSYSITSFTNVFDRTLKNMILADLLSQTVEMEVIENVRQKEGDAYMTYSDGNLSIFQPSVAFLYILFQTNVGMEENVHRTIDQILQSYIENGPSELALKKSKEYSRKRETKDKEENKYYQSKLSNYLISGIDQVTDYEQTLDSITQEDLRSFASKLISEGHKHRCVITSSRPLA